MVWSDPEIVLVRAGVCGYGVALAWHWLAGRRGGVSFRGVTVLTAAAVVCLGAAIAVRWSQSGQGPFLTLYEILLSSTFSLGLVFVAACILTRVAGFTATPVLGVLAALGLWTLSVSRDVVPLPATFDNPWLWVHLTAGKLFLGACLLGAAGAAALAMGRTTATDARDAFVWRAALTAFVFEGFMLLSGAVWAQDAWGRYWGWDPLETSALLTWLVLGALLHARVSFALPDWAARLWLNGVFVLAVLTFFGVPFFSLAPHKGIV